MDLRAAVVMPVAVGAIMWIMDMLLPDGKIARTAGAVAGIIVMQALITPLLAWLSPRPTKPTRALALNRCLPIIKTATERAGRCIHGGQVFAAAGAHGLSIRDTAGGGADYAGGKSGGRGGCRFGHD